MCKTRDLSAQQVQNYICKIALSMRTSCGQLNYIRTSKHIHNLHIYGKTGVGYSIKIYIFLLSYEPYGISM